MTKKLVLLADDHPIFRAGLRQVIESSNQFEVVSEVGDGQAAVSQIEILRPDFAVFDLSMPKLDGFSALQQVQEKGLPTHILIVSMHAEPGYAQRARELGAIGLIAKEDAASDVLHALNREIHGFYMSESVGSSGLSAINLNAATDIPEVDLSVLSVAERRVFQALSKGMTSKQIGQELHISHRTVQAHRRNIAEKLNVTGPNQLLKLAISMSSP